MTDSVLTKNQILGQKYLIDRPIGSGGFSQVYLATHIAMKRIVAIKVFDPGTQVGQESAATQRRQKRFEQEARLVSKLKHPNTITIFDFGNEADGKLFLVMEYIEGSTLQEIFRNDAPLQLQRIFLLFLQILQSLEEAHNSGILHRDLKPANIMITRNFKNEEVVKVLDFGIAQIVNEHIAETGPGGRPIFLGTPRYAAPEQLLGQPLSLATDTYAVGALLWEALLGAPMFQANKLLDYIRIASEPTPHRLPKGHGLAPEITTFLQRAVQKDPRQRYPDASAMLQALEEATALRREDLPRPDRSPFGPRRDILDPNVTDPKDDENYFLSPVPPPMPRRHLRTRPTSRSPKEHLQKDLPDPPISEPVELPQAPRARRKPSPTTSEDRPKDQTHPPRPSAPLTPAPLARTSRSDSWDKRFLILLLPFLFLALPGVLFFLQPPASESAQDLEESDPIAQGVDDAEPAARTLPSSPFTVGGIQSTLMASPNWRLTDRREAVDMQRFLFHSLVLQNHGTIVDVTIYEIVDTRAHQEITEDIRFPSEFITIGQFVVRLTPQDTRRHQSVVELRQELLLYRELVHQEANRK